MIVLKKGNKGDAVKVLQEELNKHGADLVVDGIFGVKTEEAVKAFQKAHKDDEGKPLVVDGVVGDKTWNALCPPFGNIINITKGYINTHISRLKGRVVKYIAIHYTAGGSSSPGSAMGVRNVFLKRDASADFAVDDETILQINPDLRNWYTWSVGDKKNPFTGGGRLYGIATNRNTISIEICSNLKPGTSSSAANHDGWYFTDAALENALILVRWLMREFNIPKSNVVRHYDISGKMCPGVEGWNDAYLYTIDGLQTKKKNNSSKWLEFWNRI